MAARIRLKRMGRKNRAFFRIGVFDSRTRRDGRAIEMLGHYDPLVKDEKEKAERIRELSLFVLSDNYFELRKKLGVALQAG